MRHVLAPSREDPVGKGVIEGDRVTAVEADIDPVVSQSLRGKKGDGAVLKIGDRLKDKATGKIYIIKMEIDNGTLFLEGENGLGRRLTGEKNLRRTCEKLDDIKS